MITAGTDLSINIRRVNSNLTVAGVPRRAGVKDGERIVPLILNGTPEELDAGFLQAVGTPVQKAQGILTNLETFEKQAEQAVSQSKAARSAAEKESKEVREKREKMEKLRKKALFPCLIMKASGVKKIAQFIQLFQYFRILCHN